MKVKAGLSFLPRALIFVLALVVGVPPSGAVAAPVTVPFTFVERRVVVEAKLDGNGPYAFLLDTGASNIFSSEEARALGIASGKSFFIGGTGPGRSRAALAKIGSVDLGGGIVLRDQHFIVTSMEALHRASGLARFDGLLGSELFEKYVVTIDYAARTLTFTPPEEFGPPADGTIVPFTLYGSIPQIEATVDGYTGRFVLDTGDRLSLTLMEPFVAKHHLIQTYRATVHGFTGWGFGGPVEGYVARAHHLTFAGIDIAEPVVRLPTSPGGFFTAKDLAGSIGTGIFDRFTITFDYAHKRAVFAQPREVADVYDRSGLWLTQGTNGFDVADVVKGSPADRARIARGDRIVAVDGRTAQALSLAEVRATLVGAPGTPVVLRVMRGRAAREVRFDLAELV